ncbi:hypothetical protein FJ420_06935 [Mesorhizobium sp. B3-1-3]|uniref:hypothetical protein n=1 Tax=unclassified Mesorhizobium TaxID=325217 RepID=UPI001129F555|nr:MULTISPECIES: hypothetical protein [unclassified Mesorhizobium]TPI62538.1 hypothetical protein FJ424_20410 [Mesorhizobium sp. B3-1-8]TPI74107.1 hypothetical protein FJ420_06935 [Mesorhizobium sp. B3-1-3]
MFKPLEIFNDIVNSLILGVYDIVVLILGPLIIPLITRRRSAWRFVLRVDARLNSLTLMFICFAAAVTVHTPGLLYEAFKRTAGITDGENSFTFVFVLTTILTIIFDIIFRFLVYLRTLSLKVKFSAVRLSILRLCFCVGLIGVVMAKVYLLWATPESTPRQQAEEYTSLHAPLLFVCLLIIPFSISLIHLARRWPWYTKLPIAGMFSYSFVNIALCSGWFIAFITAIFVEFGINQEHTRLFSFNTMCTVLSDGRSFSVDLDLLLRSEQYDVVSIKDGGIYADIDNFEYPLNNVKGGENILVKDHVVHAKLIGVLQPDRYKTPSHANQPATHCDATLSSPIFFDVPKRMGTMPD